MGLTYDDFIRTTEPRHKRGVQKLFTLLQERGYIYKGSYTGQYCVSDEAFVDVPPGAPCPDCGRITETVNEENYFFKLSAFERKLLEFYDDQSRLHPARNAPQRSHLAFVKAGLKDLSVSRTSFKWGIPVPGDEKHVIYVWLDALANYITAMGYGSDDPADQAKFEKYWPADLHLVGKEITRFHCVYWPAFLMAAGLPLPKSIVAHGWLLFEESKMSKSRGNVVRAETILDVLGADALRYFLLREIVFGQDGSFSFDALVQRYNSRPRQWLRQSGQPDADHDRKVFRWRRSRSHVGLRQTRIATERLAECDCRIRPVRSTQLDFSRALETRMGDRRGSRRLSDRQRSLETARERHRRAAAAHFAPPFSTPPPRPSASSPRSSTRSSPTPQQKSGRSSDSATSSTSRSEEISPGAASSPAQSSANSAPSSHAQKRTQSPVCRKSNREQHSKPTKRQQLPRQPKLRHSQPRPAHDRRRAHA